MADVKIFGRTRALDRLQGASADHSMLGRKPTGIPRIPGIDGLRGIAILIVMVSHAGMGRYIPGGFGVTIFFFLSGYLITTLLRLEYDRHGHVDLVEFYKRRAFRILPPLYITVALTIILSCMAIIDNEVTLGGFFLDVTFLTNYASLIDVRSYSPMPLWSLDIEEHFYIIFPALFLYLFRSSGNKLIITMVTVCVLVLITRYLVYYSIGESEIFYWSHTRIDSIIFGTILAMWQNPVIDKNAWRPRPIHVFLAISFIAASFLVRSPAFRETIRYSIQGASLFVIFSAIIQSRGMVASVLNQRWLHVIALLSYTLYLIHMPMLAATKSLGIFSVPLAYLLSFGWAAALYLLVEKPLARRRRLSLEKVTANKKGVSEVDGSE